MGSRATSLLLFLAACGGSDAGSPTEPPTPPTPPAHIATTLTLSGTVLAFFWLGETQQLSATVRDQNGATMSGASLAWASSVSSVAGVSSTGLVTALGAGTATIWVTSGSAIGTALVSVNPDPPFKGTIFVDPDIITFSDPTTFQSLSFAGQGSRTMFDRRVNDWITVNAYLFNATFDDGLTTQIQVNPEFGSSETALTEAQKYADAIGRLPTALRTDVETVWIHKGTELFGGGNNNLLIHTGQADLYAADGILEETFVHEAAHTSLDAAHASAPGWLAAQSADPAFISRYARDWPNREDIAESFLLYLAVRYRSDRISQSVANVILLTMPNRIAYFDDHVPLMGTGW